MMTKFRRIQLFRERLSERGARNRSERYRGWFSIHCSSKKFERMAREAMEIRLCVLKESSKSRLDSYSCQEQCIDHIPFYISGLSCAHFSDNLSLNSCIDMYVAWATFAMRRNEARTKAGGKIVNTTLNLSWYRYAQRKGFLVYMNRNIICFWHEPSWCLKTSMENGMIW